jgi:hypothetical protein
VQRDLFGQVLVQAIATKERLQAPPQLQHHCPLDRLG